MSRLNKLKAKYQQTLQELPGIPPDVINSPSFVDDIFDCLVAADPTPGNKYVSWLIEAWKNNSFTYEDIFEGKDSIVGMNCHDFERLKNKLCHPDGTPDINARSLMKYESPGQLWEAIRPLLDAEDDTASNRELKRREAEAARRHTHEVILKNGSIVRIPMTYLAAQFYGRQSRWCTASFRSAKMFLNYAGCSPLYIITTPNGSRYQAHFNDNLRLEMRDTADRKVNFKTIDEAHLSDILDFLCSKVLKANFSARYKLVTGKEIRRDKSGMFRYLTVSTYAVFARMFRRQGYYEFLSNTLKNTLIKDNTEEFIEVIPEEKSVFTTPEDKLQLKTSLLELMTQYKGLVNLEVGLQENPEVHPVIEDMKSLFDAHSPQIQSIFDEMCEEDQDPAYMDMITHVLCYNDNKYYIIKFETSLKILEYVLNEMSFNRAKGFLERWWNSKEEFSYFIYVCRDLLSRGHGENIKLPPILKADNMALLYKTISWMEPPFLETRCFRVLNQRMFTEDSYFIHEQKQALWDAYVIFVRESINEDSHGFLKRFPVPGISKSMVCDIMTDFDNHVIDYDINMARIKHYLSLGVDKKNLFHALMLVGCRPYLTYKECVRKNDDVDWEMIGHIIRLFQSDNFLIEVMCSVALQEFFSSTSTKEDNEEEKHRRAIANVKKTMRLSDEETSAAHEYVENIAITASSKDMTILSEELWNELKDIVRRYDIPESFLIKFSQKGESFPFGQYLRKAQESLSDNLKEPD